jgi:hypothetical protein
VTKRKTDAGKAMFLLQERKPTPKEVAKKHLPSQNHPSQKSDILCHYSASTFYLQESLR